CDRLVQLHSCTVSRTITERLLEQLRPWRRRWIYYSAKGCNQQDPALDKSSVVVAYLAGCQQTCFLENPLWFSHLPMVNTSMNLPQSKYCPGSTRSDFKIAPCFTCPACPPSNAIHHLQEFARTACLSVSLSLRGLLTSPQNQHTHQQ
ncbi:hypothetical protein AMECASPLE_037404, partial [Ameca splendens]